MISPAVKSSVPVPISPEKKLPMPSIPAAIGMALSYYTYPFFASGRLYLLLIIIFILALGLSFLRTIRFLPDEKISGEKNKVLIIKTSLFAAAFTVGFLLGIASGRTINSGIDTGLPPERVTGVTGILLEDPRSLNGGGGFGILKLTECSGTGGLRSSARGNLSIFFPEDSIPRLKVFGRGCEIYLDGSVYQGRRGAYFNASSVHIINPAPPLESFRTGLRMVLLERFQSRGSSIKNNSAFLLPEAPVWGGLASALILGVRDDLDVDLSDGFRDSGCIHILALSGMHLAIISGILTFLLRRPLGIRWASLFCSLFILAYIFVVGSQPSLVRSAIMYLIGAFALWGFLKGKPISLLSMAFVIQLIFMGETGISLSFMLSYLALAGILTLGESLRSLLRGRLPEIVNGSISASLGAFILTAPLAAHYFGTIRPIGIIAGLFLAPVSSLFMILSLAALAAGFLPIPLWDLLNFLLTWIYRFLVFLVSLAGKVPGFHTSLVIPVLVFSLLFWFFVLVIQKRDLSRRRSIASLD